jgi:ribosomal protein S18 acetylase RimI-like enzyme
MKIELQSVDISAFLQIEEIHKMVFHFYEEYDANRSISAECINKTIQHLISHPDHGSFRCIYLNDVLIGYTILIHYWSNEYGGIILFIDELYIKPSFRNQGLGNQFLKVLELKFPNINTFALEVSPSNKRAMSLYLKNGFIQNKNNTLIKVLS